MFFAEYAIAVLDHETPHIHSIVVAELVSWTDRV